MSNLVKIYTLYDKPVIPGFDFSDVESMTLQSAKDECDINVLVRSLTPYDERIQPERFRYGDFSDAVDFREACDFILQAREDFQSLSSDIRKHFNHDPEQFLAFVSDEANFSRCVEMGIYEAPEALTPPEAKSAEPAKSSKATSDKGSDV